VKFAFITPRYGADITSGAEHACRLLAQQLSERHDVEVLTTCGSHPATWKNDYSEGSDRIRGVLVRRFAVSQGHDRTAFTHLANRLYSSPHTRADELEWVKRFGPWSPGLIEHLNRQHRSYDVLVFFSLWHATTVHGLQIAPERSVLFPYLQLRPALRFGLWTELFSSVRAVGYLSAAEQRLASRYLHISPQAEELVGIGIDPPPQQTYPRHQQDPPDTLAADDDRTADTTISDDS